MDYSIFTIPVFLLVYYSVAFYKEYWYINKNTDKVDLIKRWVELQRIRNGFYSKRN